VAETNRNQRYRDGTLDPRDVELHKHDTEINVMALSKKHDQRGGTSSDMDEDRCWLQYVGMLVLFRMTICSDLVTILISFLFCSLWSAVRRRSWCPSIDGKVTSFVCKRWVDPSWLSYQLELHATKQHTLQLDWTTR
jgi:hypothetical protein